MKTAISMPDPLAEAADRLAKQLGISRSELIQRALERMLREVEGESITGTLNRIYGDDPGDPGVDPVLHDMQIASLADEDW